MSPRLAFRRRLYPLSTVVQAALFPRALELLAASPRVRRSLGPRVLMTNGVSRFTLACVLALLSLGALPSPGDAQEKAVSQTATTRKTVEDSPATTAYQAGVAQFDITPDTPIRLAGFGFRRAESEGVTARIWAKAMALQHGNDPPLLLMLVESCGLPAAMVDVLRDRLQADLKLPPERIALSVTHSHTAPMVSRALSTLFGEPIPEAHQRHIDEYTLELQRGLEAVARAALADLRPARLEWGIGQVDFALNRRTRGGPVDHDLPVLVIRDEKSTVRGILTTYACHCVTLSNNKISGDWAGFAMEALQREFPGAIALVTIGCGADQNPDSGVTGDRVDVAVAQGAEISREVARLARGNLTMVSGKIQATRESLSLPLAPLPDRAEWERRAKQQDAVGHHARVQLERLQRGEALRSQIDYAVQSFTFGDNFAMVFLPGEVVVDYALRLKRELDGLRIWLHAYSNDAPGYVPSERILREGGYEAGGAMTYYDIPVGYAPGLEDKIVAAVKRQLLPRFASPHAPDKLRGSRPLSPHQSLARMRVADEFQIDLVVAEPLVVDPVAIDFGAAGELWVAEMHDYPQGLRGDWEPGGRIRVVRDLDGDGNFDHSTVFLDELPFPTGVLAWRRGVLICAAPDILYAEDTDGDDRADVVRKAYSGFGIGNYQARVNSLVPGLDGWVHGSCGLFGGRIESHRGGVPLELGDRDFRLQPDLGMIEPATGRTQQGRVRDDWGNWFGCDNGNLGRHYPLDDHYLRRAPHLLPPANSVSLTQDADAARLEPAQRDAQRFKLSGAPAGITAACGIGVYRDSLLGEDYAGNLFTCEPVNLLVHRLRLVPQASGLVGRRADNEADREFWTTTDNWSRPVQARTGPDGALWIVDMYRFVIEHPRWIPEEDLKQLDLRAGSSLGRIYRVRPRDTSPSASPSASQSAGPAAPPRLDQLNDKQLVDILRSRNGTLRDMAMLRLQWRFLPSPLAGVAADETPNTESREAAAAAELRRLLHDQQALPTARLHALCLLDVLGWIQMEDVRASLKDTHESVRRHAIRISERWSEESASKLLDDLLPLASDPAPQVRLQLALSLGQWREHDTGRALTRLAMNDPSDPYLRAAVLCSLHERNTASAVAAAWDTDANAPETSALLAPLLSVATSLSDPHQTRQLIQQVCAPSRGRYTARHYKALAGILDAMTRGSLARGEAPPPVPNEAAPAIHAARQLVQDETVAVADRSAAIELLARDPQKLSEDLSTLTRLLGPQSPGPLQSASLAALARVSDPQVADAVLASWENYTPAIQAPLLDLLLGRPSWQAALLSRLEQRRIAPTTIDAARRQRLLQLSDEPLRLRAERILAAASSPARASVVEAHADVATLAGDSTRGEAVFRRVCANCHRWKDIGHPVGPDLAALANKSPAALLLEILDPNRNVDSRYLQFTAVKTDGRSAQGMLVAESATSITLAGPNSVREEILRADIDQLRGVGVSLMPEGLERDLSKQDLADILTLLTSHQAPPKQFAGNHPAVVLPRAGTFALRAVDAEIRGGDIQFETPFQNVGYWHGVQDHVSWVIESPREESFDVYLDAACAPDAAGNRFVIEIASQPALRDTIASTGGWDQYRQVKLGTVKLTAGRQRWVMRPEGPTLRGALVDLRALLLVPQGSPLKIAMVAPSGPATSSPSATFPSAAELAHFLLDDSKPSADREAAVARHPSLAAETIREMARGLTGEASQQKEEYRRIPWIWRVAIDTGKRPDPPSWRKVLEVALPAHDEPLRDWQAVVLGGGIINGISLQGKWPVREIASLLAGEPNLSQRWQSALEKSAKMADDERIATGTRYDALRMLALDDWAKRGEQLSRYLRRGTHAELQMGAISGASDVELPTVTPLLLSGLEHFSDANRRLAIDALLRTPDRKSALRNAIESRKVPREWLSEPQARALAND